MATFRPASVGTVAIPRESMRRCTMRDLCTHGHDLPTTRAEPSINQ